MWKTKRKDFQIWKSPKENSRLGDSINIQPPTIKYFGKFRPRIFFEDENIWKELERHIWNNYTLKIIEDESLEVKNIVVPEEEMPF